MVQSFDNDIQESARLLQGMMEETSGGSYRHIAEPGTGGDGKARLSAVAHQPMAHHLYSLHIYVIVTTHCSVAYTNIMELVNEKKRS